MLRFMEATKDKDMCHQTPPLLSHNEPLASTVTKKDNPLNRPVLAERLGYAGLQIGLGQRSIGRKCRPVWLMRVQTVGSMQRYLHRVGHGLREVHTQ